MLGSYLTTTPFLWNYLMKRVSVSNAMKLSRFHFSDRVSVSSNYQWNEQPNSLAFIISWWTFHSISIQQAVWKLVFLSYRKQMAVTPWKDMIPFIKTISEIWSLDHKTMDPTCRIRTTIHITWERGRKPEEEYLYKPTARRRSPGGCSSQSPRNVRSSSFN